jgi:hypothetical protein
MKVVGYVRHAIAHRSASDLLAISAALISSHSCSYSGSKLHDAYQGGQGLLERLLLRIHSVLSLHRTEFGRRDGP